jgi:hypothetical protein
MARKSRPTQIPTTFVGTFYDVESGVYIAVRKDSSVTVGQIGRRGVNVGFGLIGGSSVVTDTEH